MISILLIWLICGALNAVIVLYTEKTNLSLSDIYYSLVFGLLGLLFTIGELIEDWEK